jgi:signal transduction histidine kinase
MQDVSQNLLEHWPGILFRQRPDLTFEFASPRLAELTGLPLERWHRDPELFWKVVHESDADDLRQQIIRVSAVPQGFTTSFRLRQAISGRVAYISEFRRPLFDPGGRLQGYEGFWLDQTRQTVSEKRLATAAWKETLALLTIGLSHDFNNVLGGILGLSETFLSQIPPDHPFHEGLTLMKRNAQQAAQLVQRMVQLHHVKAGNRGYHDLNAIVAESGDLVRKIIPRHFDFSVHLDANPLPLYADAVELQQVIINLALNAADAMTDRGKLSFQTSLHAELALRDYQVGARPRLPAVCLSVADTGAGIQPRHLGSIFDPFFTTKPMNKGSGLGLYNTRLFIERHHGAISVESGEGTGTTFHLWLPQADFTEADTAHELSSRRRRSLLVAGQAGRTLDSTAEFLRQHGSQVATAGTDAEDFLRSPDQSFDALLVLVEPRDTSWLPLLKFVRRQRLPLKVIVQTVGCNPDEVDSQLLAKADLVIPADLSQEMIVKKLAEALG